jgi:hypothetical protein
MCIPLPLLGNGKGIHSPVYSSKLLLVLASSVILGSESYGTYDHILLSDGSGTYGPLLRLYLY